VHKKQYRTPKWLRKILAYGVAIAGILSLPLLTALLLKSWVIGLWLIVIVIPLFPAIQTILLREKPVTSLNFLKIYFTELASFSLQIGFLLVSAPIIVIMVASRLVIGLSVVAVISWFIVGLQQLGVKIGAKMPKHDIIILLWITMGLTAAVGIFYLFYRLGKKYEDSFFNLWARQFKKIREHCRYENLEEESGE
jgi:hypothetical protein